MNRVVCIWVSLVLLLSMAQIVRGQKNLITGDSSFETGYGLWHKGGEIDSTTAFDGSRSVKVEDALQTWERFHLTHGKPYTFSVYLKADQPGAKVRLQAKRFDWGPDSPQKVVTVGTEWARYSLTVPPEHDDWQHVWLWVHRLKGSGQFVWVDACQLEQSAGATAYASAEPVSVACQVQSPVEGNLFLPDEKVKLAFNLYNSQAREASVKFFYEVKDYYTETVVSETVPLKTAAKGTLSHQVDLGLLAKKGFYVVRYGLAGEPEGSARTATFCVVARPLAYDPKEGSLFGNTWFNDVRTPTIARMGTKWTVGLFYWRHIEGEKGKFDEAYLAGKDEKLAHLKQHGINVIGHIHRTPNWAGEYADQFALPSPAGVAAYEEFTYKMVNRYKDRINCWMSWGGEDDLHLSRHVARTGKSEDWVMSRFAAIMKAGYRGAKRADSTCVFGGTGRVSGVDCAHHYPFSRKLLQLAGTHTDSYCFDPYTWPRTYGGGRRVQTPEEHGLISVLEEAVAMAGNRKCWIAEYGISLDLKEAMDSLPAKQQADFLARSFILTANVPRVEILQWFSVKANIEAGSDYDMWRWPNPMPMVAAYSAAAQVLTGVKNPRRIPMGTIRAYCFSKKSGSVAALWVPADREIPIRLGEAEGVRVLDIMGNEMDRSGSIDLDGSPVYLVGDMSQEALAAIVGQIQIDMPPVIVALQLVDSTCLKAHLANQIHQTLNGTVVVALPLKGLGLHQVRGGFSRLLPGETKVVDVKLPREIDLAELAKYTAVGKVKTNRGEVDISQDLSLMACGAMDRAITIDGDLADWAGRDGIELKDASYIAPPDAAVHKLWTGEKDLSVRACCGWDSKLKVFYFAADVTDDIHANDSAKDCIYYGDCVQLGFDTKNDALGTKPAKYEDDDVEICLGYSEKLKAAVVHRSWPATTDRSKAQVAVRRVDGHTYYELAVPFEELPSLQAVSGKVFGFNFVVLDRDEGTKTNYWLGLTPGICGSKDPRAFNRFILLGAPVGSAAGKRKENCWF